MENIADIWKKIMYLSNGTDTNGVALSSGFIAIDQIISKSELRTLKNLPIMDGIFQIHSSGGCAVITIDIPGKSKGIALQIKKMCDEWIESLDNPEFDDRILTLTITPVLLQGYLYLVYNQLVYAEIMDIDTGVKLILGFDNTQTIPVQNEESNFYDIVMEEEQELRNQEEEIRRSILEAEAIVEKNKNPYEKFVEEKYSKEAINKEPEQLKEDKPKRDYFS